MKRLTLEDIVIGKDYVIVKESEDFKTGGIVTAIGKESKKYFNDSNSHAFTPKGSSDYNKYTYLSYDEIKEQEIDMTPCKELGYEEGQVFEVIKDNRGNYSAGSIIILNVDDGTNVPFFKLIKGYDSNEGSHRDGTCMRLHEIKRLYPTPEPKLAPPSADVTVVCEGKETTISRSSAEKLNLI